MKSYNLVLIFKKEKSGYSAYCPDLKNCSARGKTVEEVLKNIRKILKERNKKGLSIKNIFSFKKRTKNC